MVAIALENGPFIDDFPIKTSIYKGFSMAMLNNQMVLYVYIYTGNKVGFNHQQMAKTYGIFGTSCHHRALVAAPPLQWTRDGVPGVQGEDLNQGVHPE